MCGSRMTYQQALTFLKEWEAASLHPMEPPECGETQTVTKSHYNLKILSGSSA